MKLLSKVFISEVDGQYVAVTAGKAGEKFSGMIRMNATAAFVMQNLQKKTTEENLVSALKREYEVSDEDARRNVAAVLRNLRNAGLLEE